MFGAVNRDEHKFVFGGEDGELTAVEGERGLTLEKLLNGQGPREITESPFGVEFDDRSGLRAVKEILAGNLAGLHGGGRYARLEAGRGEDLRGLRYLRVAEKQINVAVMARGGVSIGAESQRRAFDHGGIEPGVLQKFEDAEELGR